MSLSADRSAPQDERFYSLFRRLASKGMEASRRFRLLLDHFPEDLPQAVTDIRLLEHEADVLVHELESRLNFARVTPMDREDIHALAGRLDDIVDNIEATTDRLMLFRVEGPTDHLFRFADALVRCSGAVEASVNALVSGSRDDLLAQCHQINEIENEADQILRDSLSYLFSGDCQPLDVIKWKEIYDFIEQATDACEDVADVLETVAFKAA